MLEGHYLLDSAFDNNSTTLLCWKIKLLCFFTIAKKRHEMKNKQSLRKQSVLLQHIYLLLLSTLLI